jgi:RNA polymerase sigma-70 factor (ECF subfamily)
LAGQPEDRTSLFGADQKPQHGPSGHPAFDPAGFKPRPGCRITFERQIPGRRRAIAAMQKNRAVRPAWSCAWSALLFLRGNVIQPRVGSRPPMRKTPSEFLPTRASLLERLKDWQDQQGWQEFFDLYWQLIYNTSLRAGLNDAEAQDVVQETLISVARQMPGFQYDPGKGSFKAWLLNLTRWRITDQWRKRDKHAAEHRPAPADDGNRTATVERIAAPPEHGIEGIWDEEWGRHTMDTALQQVRRKVKPAQYQVFDLYVIKEWPVNKVAETLGIKASQVYLIKHRVSRLLQEELALLEQRGRAAS